MEPSTLAPVQQNTLADIVTIRIREAIIRGQLRPGERLAEPSLAEQMNVSRSPVREALHRLAEDGLLHRQTNRSCYVWSPTEADVDEILSLRVMIESLAAEWTIDRLDDRDFAHLTALIEQQKETIDQEDFLPLIRQDKSFHEYFCHKAGHSRLINWWQQIMGQWEILIYRHMKHNSAEVMPTVLSDHQAILEAMQRRELDQVVALHRTINRRVSKHVKDILHLDTAENPAGPEL